MLIPSGNFRFFFSAVGTGAAMVEATFEIVTVLGAGAAGAFT